MENKISFTAYLKDEYTKRFDAMVDATDAGVKEMVKDLDKLTGATSKVARNIDTIDKRISVLQKAKKMSLDTTTIRHANDELKALQKEKEKLEGNSGSQGSGGFGLNKGFAIAGGAYAVAAGIKEIGDKAVDATVKYQKYQAALGNTIGADKASNVMSQISELATKTPFQVDELTQAYVRLQNRGFKPNMEMLTKIGDLAASQGKDYMQVAEAVLDAPVKQFIRLQEALGVDVQTLKGGMLKFTGLGQTKIIKDDPEEIKKTVLAFGQMNGIMGSMASISKTTGGAISNLEDSIDLTYKALGDRFKPEIDASIGGLSSLVSIVKKWVEIPVSETLQKETNHLQALRVELGATNTTEARRKEILEEVKKIQHDVVDETKSEAEQLASLNGKLDEYIGKRKQQLAMQRVKENFADQMAAYQEGSEKVSKGSGDALAAVALAQTLSNGGLKLDGLSTGQQQIAARTYLQSRIDKDQLTNRKSEFIQTSSGSGYTNTYSDEHTALRMLDAAIGENKRGVKQMQENAGAMQQYNKAITALDKLTGNIAGTTKPGKSTGGGVTGKGKGKSSAGGDGSISGGGRVNNFTIQINNLVSGLTIQSTTVREGAAKMKDYVVDALATAVNDSQLVIGN